MSYNSKYTGEEIENKLDRIKSPIVISDAYSEGITSVELSDSDVYVLNSTRGGYTISLNGVNLSMGGSAVVWHHPGINIIYESSDVPNIIINKTFTSTQTTSGTPLRKIELIKINGALLVNAQTQLDNALSTTSNNAVQNSTIAKAINNINS